MWFNYHGSRGEPPHPEVREPTPAELLRRCPFCGQLPDNRATSWCPSFDELLNAASTSQEVN